MTDGGDILREAKELYKRTVALTDRWTPLKAHRVQSLLMWHPARFKDIPAGRRSGKTEIAKRDVVTELLVDRPFTTKLLIGAPTYTRTKDIYMEDILALIPKFWIKKIRESLHYMELMMQWGATIRFVGMSNPQTVEGVPWDKVWIDEFADCPEACFETNIRPALATPGREGKAWLLGVPDEVGTNQKEHEKLFEIGLRWPEDPDICSFWWPSSDIMDAKEVEHMAATMDAQLFDQEINGRFVRAGGKAFSTFNVAYHVKADYSAYCEALPVDFSFDFGSASAAGIIGQSYKRNAWIIGEVESTSSSSDVLAQSLLDEARTLGLSTRFIRVYGDAAGRTPGSNIGKSDYEIIADQLRGSRVEFNNFIANPPIKDTINAVRVALRSRLGIIGLHIHPRCKRLIEQIKEADWPSADNLKSLHLLATLRYYLTKLFGVGQTSSGVAGTSRAAISAPRQLSARYS